MKPPLTKKQLLNRLQNMIDVTEAKLNDFSIEIHPYDARRLAERVRRLNEAYEYVKHSFDYETFSLMQLEKKFKTRIA